MKFWTKQLPQPSAPWGFNYVNIVSAVVTDFHSNKAADIIARAEQYENPFLVLWQNTQEGTKIL